MIAQNATWSSWLAAHEGKINYLPEYGQQKKTDQEIEIDNKFIKAITDLGYTKEKGSEIFSGKGWTFLRQGDLESAMLRFNQSWLLDSTNVNALWGYGAILGKLQNPTEAIKYLNRAYSYDSNTIRLLIDISASHLVRYNIEKNTSDLDQGLSTLLRYLEKDGENEEALYKTAIFYFHMEDYKSSWEYIHKCEEVGGGPIKKRFIKSLKKKMRKPKAK